MCGVSNYVVKLRADVLSAENLEWLGHIFDFATLPVNVADNILLGKTHRTVF